VYSADGSTRPRVVIIGAGFGGLAAAHRLARAPLDVTVVDRTNHHLFSPLLYQVATGILAAGEIAPSIRKLLRRHVNVTVMLAEATGIDLKAGRVQLRGVDGQVHQLGYDYLIVASGAVDSYFGHDQWAAHSFPMKTLAQAVALRDRILSGYERAAQASDVDARREWTSFALVGAGPTGVELAGQLATMARELHRQFHRINTEQARITLIDAGSQVLAAFPATLRAHAHRTLSGMGVHLRLGAQAVDVDDTGVTVKTRDEWTDRISARTVIWSAGVVASALGRQLGEAAGATVDHKGRVRVNSDCSLPGHPRVFAIGDVANHDDLPGLAEPAMQQGWYVARRIRAQVAGQPLPGPFRYWDLGTMATISPTDAVADIFGVKLSGVPAKIAWAGVHVGFLAGWGNRAGVLARWATAMATRSRVEQVILEGLGDTGALAQLARADEPGQLRRPRE
jgi:NADH:ubiquinone reductase (H+-translocating)